MRGTVCGRGKNLRLYLLCLESFVFSTRPALDSLNTDIHASGRCQHFVQSPSGHSSTSHRPSSRHLHTILHYDSLQDISYVGRKRGVTDFFKMHHRKFWKNNFQNFRFYFFKINLFFRCCLIFPVIPRFQIFPIFLLLKLPYFSGFPEISENFPLL